MPAAVPDRYRLEMRLGRDGDLEEWLATDTSLERPVLVRSLGPESSVERRNQFVSSVSAAAKTTHSHLARVFAVEIVAGGAYSVSEWTGGATAQDRVDAAQTFEFEEFLPNAAGLAGALAALHEVGGVHGSLDLSAIYYSVAHPAKLGAFGRPPKTDANGDVRSLSAALETALTGSPPGGPPPSERIDGIPRTLDAVLRSGQSGRLSSADLAKALLSSPTPRMPRPEPRSTSRRLLLAAGILVVLAIALVAVGLLFTGEAPVVPASPSSTLPETPATTVVATTTIPPAAPVTVLGATSFDPFGEGGESDTLIPNLVDDDSSTIWRTERYQDPLPLLKPGVGFRVEIEGEPSRVELFGLSPGTDFELFWSSNGDAALADWERIAGAQALPGTTSVDLPGRMDGYWLVWLVALPQQSDGTFSSSIAEVRFVG
jgi:serine/threonine protein kinase